MCSPPPGAGPRRQTCSWCWSTWLSPNGRRSWWNAAAARARVGSPSRGGGSSTAAGAAHAGATPLWLALAMRRFEIDGRIVALDHAPVFGGKTRDLLARHTVRDLAEVR